MVQRVEVMIKYKSGDIIKETTEAIVNPVNCVGVMGAGLALQFKNAFPENFKAYVKACQDGKEKIQPGRIFIFNTNKPNNPRYIINFATKRHWRDKSRIEDIEEGLGTLVEAVEQLKIQSIAIPALGCGLGGLRWIEVKPLINGMFSPLAEVYTIIYEPQGTSGKDGMRPRG